MIDCLSVVQFRKVLESHKNKGEKVVDYEETIKNTLKAVVKFLANRAHATRNMTEYGAIIRNASAVHDLAENPRGITDAKWNDASGFDNAAYAAFNELLSAAHRFYGATCGYHREVAKQDILRLAKRWNYLKSNNLLKGLYYPFVPKTAFAAKRLFDNTKTR